MEVSMSHKDNAQWSGLKSIKTRQKYGAHVPLVSSVEGVVSCQIHWMRHKDRGTICYRQLQKANNGKENHTRGAKEKRKSWQTSVEKNPVNVGIKKYFYIQEYK